VLPLVFLVQIAFIVAFGVLLDTFVVRSLLVPAAAYDIGPRVWWPSRFEADRAGPGGADAGAGPAVAPVGSGTAGSAGSAGADAGSDAGAAVRGTVADPPGPEAVRP
jgi:hypothetical protein